MSTITYNGIVLPEQIRKLYISRTQETLEFSSVHMVPRADFKQLCEDICQDNKSFEIEAGSYTEVFLLNDDDNGNATPVTGIKAVLEKLAEPADGESNILVRFLVRANFQAPGGTGIQKYNISWTQNDQGIYVLTIEGDMTGIADADALATFDAQIETLENFAKALLGDNDDGNLSNTLFDEPSTFIQLNQNSGALHFTRSFNELADPANQYTSAEARDNTIIFPQWSVRRTKTLRKGLNVPHLTVFTVSWTARLNKDKSDASFIAQHDAAIRSLVIRRIKTMFADGGALVLEDDNIDYSPTGKTASAIWTVSSNSSMVSYKEVLRAVVTVADSDKVLDNEDFTEAPFSPGARLDLTQTVVHVQRGDPPPVPPAPLVSFAGKTLPMFLRSFSPEESHEFVGEETGSDIGSTIQATDYTLNWEANYRAMASSTFTGGDRSQVAQGEKMNVQGKIIKPVGAEGVGGGGSPRGPSGSSGGGHAGQFE